MTTNVDRAAEVIAPCITRDSDHAQDIAALLAAEGLLMPDLPVPDRNGCFWPLRGRSYGHVRRTMIQPHVGDPFPGVIIARGGPGESSRHTSMTLTRAEALELAGILTAAAMEEA